MEKLKTLIERISKNKKLKRNKLKKSKIETKNSNEKSQKTK